jgi:hypothetical protein
MLLIELAGTANSLVRMEDVKHAHFLFVVLGRTKANQLSGAKFGVPCAPHLQTQFWHPAIAMSFCTHSSAICIQSYGKFMVQLWHILA